MKKLKFYRNTTIYIPTQESTAIENAKTEISQLDGISDGEIVLARYQENQTDGTKTLICVRHDNNNDTGWTFIEESNDGDYYTKEEIDDAEETIAQALSDLDERVVKNADAISSMPGLSSRMAQAESDITEIGETIDENEQITAVALSDLDSRLTELEEQSPIEYTETDPVFEASPAHGITSSDITNWNGKTSNVGTVTGVKMNNGTASTPDSNGIVDLGTVITSHQSLASYADGAEYDSQNKLIYLKHGNTRLSNPIDATDFPFISARPYEQVTLSEANYTIEPYKLYNIGTINNRAVSIYFDTTKEISGYASEYAIRFVSGTGSFGVTLPNGVLWANGTAPTYVTGHTYEINIVNNLAVFGEFY